MSKKKNKAFMSLRNKLLLSVVIIMIAATAIVAYFFSQMSEPAQIVVFSITSAIMVALLFLLLLPKIEIFSKGNYSAKPITKKSLKSKILVVDDSKANRKILTETLSDFDYAHIEAESGKQAINAYTKNKVSLILMDIEMDDMNGMEAVESIRKNETGNNRIPVIAISAHNDKEKIHKALVAGFDDFLPKPIGNEKLKECIDKWLGIGKPLKLSPKQPMHDNEKQKYYSSFSEKQNSKDNNTGKTVDIKLSLTYSHNKPDLAKDMLSMLINLIIKEKENIKALFEGQNWEELGQVVHKINGGSCYCGVPELQQEAERIDKALQHNKIDDVKQQFESFIVALERLIQWSEEHDLDIIFGD
jgi:two-component system sensor histidine kinase BarA